MTNPICRAALYYFLIVYFKGLLQTLKLYAGHPQDLVKCNAEFDFPSGSGSGDFEPIDGSGDVDFDNVVVSSSAADVTLSLNNSDTSSSSSSFKNINNMIALLSICFLLPSVFTSLMYASLH